MPYTTLLYQRWRQIAQEQGSTWALRDSGSGQQWSFAEMARITETAAPDVQPIVYPQGHTADFIFAVLRAWRSGGLICPCEPGQTPLSVSAPPASCIHLKTTSATNGTPQVIAFTGSQLAADAGNICATMGLRPDWPNLGVISMAHSYGFSNLVLPLLLHGIPLIIAPFSLPEAIRRAAAGESALTLAAVPALWRAWHEARAIPPNVRLAISAGAPLPLDLEREIYAADGLKIHNFYGSSECGGIAYDASTLPRSNDACVGTPLSNVELTLNGDECLQVQSGAVGETYWPEPSKNLGSGRFQTADLADLRDGFVYLRGRSSDLINIAGRKVSPEVIERLLLEHDAVHECLVFGTPSVDTDRTDMIVACIVAKPSLTAKQLRHYLLDKLPAWQVPRHWWFLESITANARGKVSRAEWQKRFLASKHTTPPESSR